MTTRSERDKKTKARQNLKNNSLIIGCVIFLSMLGYGILDHLFRTVLSQLDVVSKEYSCNRNGCEYNIEVFNSDYVGLDAVVTVIAYKRVWHGDVKTMEVVSRDRKTFRIESKENVNLKSFIKTAIKPSVLEFMVNVQE